MERKGYITIFVAFCIAGSFFVIGCDKFSSARGGGSVFQSQSSSDVDQLLDEYEETVNRYVPRFKEASTPMEFSSISMELTNEAQNFINRFNVISYTIDPKDFGSLQSRLNRINQKYSSLCQGGR